MSNAANGNFPACGGPGFLRALAFTALLLASAALSTRTAHAATLPAFPTSFIDTTYSLPTGGSTVAVHSGGNLQAAINNAHLGDVIVVDAGAIFNAPITLPNKTTGSGWIYIVSSAYTSLPAPGNRVSPADAVNMPKILVADVNSYSAVQTSAAGGAHHYRFVGFEFGLAAGSNASTVNGYYLYDVTIGGQGETSTAQLPHDITFDRCYFHGDPTLGARRGLQLDAIRGAVIDSYFQDFKAVGYDTQAVWALNTPGPLKIVNNYLEAAGENILFGGDDPTINGVIPSDVEIRGNHFFKQTSWIGSSWTVKNLIELKLGVRVLIEGNIFENNWLAAQDGEGIVITPRNQNNTAPWSATQDITVRLNKILNVGKGMDISGTDDTFSSQFTHRVLVENNVFNVTALQGASDRVFQFTHGADNVTIRHNTGFILPNHGVSVIASDQDGSIAISPKGNLLDFRDNLLSVGLNGGFYGDATGEGTVGLNQFFTNYTFLKNAIYGSSFYGVVKAALYPANNFFPTSSSTVGFVNYTDPATNFAGGNYALAASSPLKNAASDGLDVGADFGAIATATSCASAGACLAPPPPPDVTPPAISGVGATAIVFNGATIVWTTDEGATTRVDYGLTSAYGSSTTVNTTMVTSHSQALTGLTALTLYHFRVTSRDAAGNSVTSGDFTFTTAPTPGASLGLSATSVDFGGESMNTTSPVQTVIATNTGGASLTISGVAVASPFSQSNNCSTLASAATCTISITFAPAVAAGALNSTVPAAGTLSVSSTAPGSPKSIPITGTAEKSLVTHYYRSILSRAPDQAGHDFWQGEAARVAGLGANVNETWFALAMSFYRSPEYAAFGRNNAGYVADLYNTFFNRAPDAAGSTYWLGQMSQGMPRESVLLAFLFSQEFANFTQAIFGNTAVRPEMDMTMDMYRGILQRLPDSAGFTFFLGQFRQAQCSGAGAVRSEANTVSQQFFSSPEYANLNRSNAQYMSDIYNAIMRRGPDVAGINFWVQQLNGGAQTRDQVRQQFVQSTEFNNRVTNVINAGCTQ